MKIKIALFLMLPLLLLTVTTPSAFAIGRLQGVGQVLGKNEHAVLASQAGQLKSCQAREAAIKNRSLHLTKLATGMETKFDAIAGRVEAYYTAKVVPSGKTVSNYNTLVADIQTQKTNIQTAVTKAQNDANSFSCTGSTPKAQMTQFRIDMQSVKGALKEYRTSIKNLIVAVRSITGTENSEGTPSATKGENK